MSPLCAFKRPEMATLNLFLQVWPSTDPSNIHPTNKQDVSIRLASQILSIEYGLGQSLVVPSYAGSSLMIDGSVTAVDVELRGCVGGCSVSPAFYPPGCLANTSASFMLLVADASGKVTAVNATATPLAGMGSLRISVPTPSTPFTVVGSSYGHASYPIAHTFNAQVASIALIYLHLHRICAFRSALTHWAGHAFAAMVLRPVWSAMLGH